MYVDQKCAVILRFIAMQIGAMYHDALDCTGQGDCISKVHSKVVLKHTDNIVKSYCNLMQGALCEFFNSHSAVGCFGCNILGAILSPGHTSESREPLLTIMPGRKPLSALLFSDIFLASQTPAVK